MTPTKRVHNVARCGTSADAAPLARLELRALGVRDADDQPDAWCLGYLRALRDTDRSGREDLDS